jgi:hypothetical protein
MYIVWTNNCTKVRVHIPFSFYENLTFVSRGWNLILKNQAMGEKIEKKMEMSSIKHLRTNLAPSPPYSTVVELLKGCCALGSAWPGVELRFFPWLPLFLCWTGGPDLSSSLCHYNVIENWKWLLARPQAGMSLTNLSEVRNNLTARKSLVSDIRAGTGKSITFIYSVIAVSDLCCDT